VKNHIVAESLILPAFKIIVRRVIGKTAESEIDKVRIFYNTVSRRVDDVTRC
jgi:hypothetical protein